MIQVMGMSILLILATGIVGGEETPRQGFKERTKFYGTIYPWIKKAECGVCKKICHYDPNDRGGFTCIGIAVASNPGFYAKVLNEQSKSCKLNYNSDLVCKKGYTLDRLFREFYYEKYYKPYKKCSKKVALMLTDSAILEGHNAATRNFQKAYGLKADGVFGRKSIKKCKKNLNTAKFSKVRVKRFKKLKTYKHHGKGWMIRLKKLQLYMNKL